MKKTLKLIPAIAMLLISAVMLSTATFAWFSMNSQVTATGMQVRAQAEGGIVISNADQETWTASATAKNGGPADLIPTSTADTTNWYHNTSDDAKNAKAGQPTESYGTALSVTVNSGVGNVTMDAQTKAIYLVNTFYIKSSAEAISMSTGSLYINKVEAAFPATVNTGNLDKALRVAVVVSDGTTSFQKIFAPVEGATTEYKVKNQTTVSVAAGNLVASGTKNIATGIVDIPAYSSNSPITATIYCYFEGEDANCKSEYIASVMDELTVNVQFGTTAIAVGP